jgi:hypothetical protein
MSRIIGMNQAVQAAAREYRKSGTVYGKSRLVMSVEILTAGERTPAEVAETLRQQGAPELAAVVESHASRSTLSEFREWFALIVSLLSLVIALNDRDQVSDAEIDRIVASLVQALEGQEGAHAPPPDTGSGAGGGQTETQ